MKSFLEFDDDLFRERATAARDKPFAVQRCGDLRNALAFLSQPADSLRDVLFGLRVAERMNGDPQPSFRDETATPGDADLGDSVGIAQLVHVIYQCAQ